MLLGPISTKNKYQKVMARQKQLFRAMPVAQNSYSQEKLRLICTGFTNQWQRKYAVYLFINSIHW